MRGVDASRGARDHTRVQHPGAVHRRVRSVHRAVECGMLRCSGEGASQGAVEFRMQRVHRRGGCGGGRVERVVEKGGTYSGRALRSAGRRTLRRD